MPTPLQGKPGTYSTKQAPCTVPAGPPPGTVQSGTPRGSGGAGSYKRRPRVLLIAPLLLLPAGMRCCHHPYPYRYLLPLLKNASPWALVRLRKGRRWGWRGWGGAGAGARRRGWRGVPVRRRMHPKIRDTGTCVDLVPGMCVCLQYATPLKNSRNSCSEPGSSSSCCLLTILLLLSRMT